MNTLPEKRKLISGSTLLLTQILPKKKISKTIFQVQIIKTKVNKILITNCPL